MDLAIKIVPIAISLLSLLVATLVAWSNRKTLHVEISSDLRIIEPGNLFILDNDDTYPYPYALYGWIEVVNPSSKDIAFFDLRFFYPETNINVNLLTRRAMLPQYRDKPVWLAHNGENGNTEMQEMFIPETNFGIFKSNSFNRFHVIVFPSDKAERINFSFKVAMKAKVRDQFATTGRKKFKFHGYSYDIKGWSNSQK